MSWVPVNTFVEDIQDITHIDDDLPSPDKSISLSTASKYRVNILASAEEIAKSCVKRRRVSTAMRKTPVQSTKIAKVHPARVTIIGQVTKPKFSKEKAQGLTPGTRNTRSSPIKDGSPSVLEISGTGLRAHGHGMTHSSQWLKEVAVPSPYPMTATRPSSKNPSQRIDALSPTNAMQISSDDNESFESFDFDSDSFDTHIKVIDNSQSSTMFPVIIATSPLPLHDELIRARSQAKTIDGKFKKPSCAPFMHPCLLEPSNPKSAVAARGAGIAPSQISPHYTCFRTAELLRLNKAFQSGSLADDVSIQVELFAIVHDVIYADNLGRGQGVVFADIFFSTRPPFINIASNIPYSARDLIGIEAEGADKRLFRATIRISGLRHKVKTSAMRSQMTGTREICSSMRSGPEFPFELIDINRSSWDEIDESKRWIEMGIEAREIAARQRPVLELTSGNTLKRRDGDLMMPQIKSAHLGQLDKSTLDRLTNSVELSDAENHPGRL